MDKVEYYRSKLEKALQEKNKFTDVIAQIEAKTGVNRVYLVAGLIAVLALYLIFGYGATFLATFLGFLYPAYCSIKAIESKDKDDDTKWVTYWVVFAFFSLLEFFSDIFLFWIPLYAFLKCLFFTYCMAPFRGNGSILIYNKIIKPCFLRHEKEIDSGINKMKNLAASQFEKAEAAREEAAKYRSE